MTSILRTRPLSSLLALAAAALLVAPASSLARTTGDSTPVRGGTLRAAMPDNPDHLDPGLSYTNEGWEMLETTNNGLLTFKKAAGAEGNLIVPDIAAALPTVSDGGKTYTFKVRTGVMFSAPISRAVQPSDFKFSIERLFRIDSGGVGFYSGIVGADAYAKTRKGGIKGIVANDKAHTITFHLTAPDGTFLDYMAVPFAFALPKGTPDKDISTIAKWRVSTGPYRISGYTPKDSIEITRNPTFTSWTKDTPDGYLDGIDVKLGVTPDQAVTETANDQLDWYFEPVAPARLTELKARYPKQVFDFTRNNVTYFTMNSRKPPFDKLAVRQAVNYATNRAAFVKLFGGQGSVSENILPPGMGSAFKAHSFYPYDLAKAKALVASSGTKGMAVTVWSHTTDPTPKAAQYMASILAQLGYKATVKTLDESVYWDTISAQKTNPQIAFQDWNQDFPEGQDFIDVILNGEGIVDVGNNNASNSNVPELNALIDKAKAMPVGPERDAAWAELDKRFMAEDAGWAPFMNRTFPKFWSSRLHGVVFNTSYYELFTSMWLAP